MIKRVPGDLFTLPGGDRLAIVLHVQNQAQCSLIRTIDPAARIAATFARMTAVSVVASPGDGT